MMMGLSLYFAIACNISGVKAPAAAAAPVRRKSVPSKRVLSQTHQVRNKMNSDNQYDTLQKI